MGNVGKWIRKKFFGKHKERREPLEDILGKLCEHVEEEPYVPAEGEREGIYLSCALCNQEIEPDEEGEYPPHVDCGTNRNTHFHDYRAQIGEDK